MTPSTVPRRRAAARCWARSSTRRLGLARHAPRGPEVQHDDLARAGRRASACRSPPSTGSVRGSGARGPFAAATRLVERRVPRARGRARRRAGRRGRPRDERPRGRETAGAASRQQPSVPGRTAFPRPARIGRRADVAQLVERELPKLEVAGSRPVVRLPRLARRSADRRAARALSSRRGWRPTASSPRGASRRRSSASGTSLGERPATRSGGRACARSTVLEPGEQATRRRHAASHEVAQQAALLAGVRLRVTRSSRRTCHGGPGQRRARRRGVWRLFEGAGGHRAAVQLGRVDDAGLDEPPVAAGAPRVHVEPRLRHAPGGTGWPRSSAPNSSRLVEHLSSSQIAGQMGICGLTIRVNGRPSDRQGTWYGCANTGTIPLRVHATRTRRSSTPRLPRGGHS